jgi:hypothetical protein
LNADRAPQLTAVVGLLFGAEKLGVNNMFWIVSTLLGILFLGALVRLVIFFRGRDDLLPKSDRVMGRERHLALALVNAFLSGFGFFLLLSRTFEPMDILIGLSIVSLLVEVAFRKGSVNWAG